MMYKLLVFTLYIGLTIPVYADDLRQDVSFHAETIENAEVLSLSIGSSSEAKNIFYAGVSLNLINSSTPISYSDRKTIYPIYIFIGFKGPWKISPYIEGGVDLLDIIIDDIFRGEDAESDADIDFYFSGGLKLSITNDITVSLYVKEYIFKFDEQLTKRQLRLSRIGYGAGVTFHF